MSDRKVFDADALPMRLASIEAPEFLDQLVLERARIVLVDSAQRSQVRDAEPRTRTLQRAPAPVAALLGLVRLKSS